MQRRIVPLLVSLSLACASNAGEPARTTLSVKGLACAGCAEAFERQLVKVHGVTAQAVSPDKGEVLVSYDPDKTDAGAIGESLLKLGFDVRLSPWEPVDASFNGCSNGWCGSRRPNARVSAQPGAAIGAEVYCPVSGVILRIKDSTPKADLGGGTVYVCCEGCLRYLQAHRDRVLALRGARQSS